MQGSIHGGLDSAMRFLTRPNHRTFVLPFLLTVLGLSTCFIFILQKNDLKSKSLKSSEKNETQIQRRKLNRCQQDVFSDEELSRMCSKTVSKPKCLVTQLDHLKQSAFYPANLSLPSGNSCQIFVNPPSDGMADFIIQQGGWESSSVQLVLRALAAVPGSALIDVGCNFGVYSLAAATAGHRTVCVEASYQIAMRVRKSAQINQLTNRMSVFWNAVSADRSKVKLRAPSDCNFAMLKTYSHSEKRGPRHQNYEVMMDPIAVDTIGLDDVTVFNEDLKGVEDLVIKVDIEGSEWNVFATAAATFQHFNVSMVLMEWEWTVEYFPEMTLFICSFFTNRGFAAHEIQDGRPGRALSVSSRLEWPPDVLWLNQKSQLKQLLLDEG